MRVYELIELLEKVMKRDAFVCVNNSSDAMNNLVRNVVVEHDMSDDEVVVILKTEINK